MKTFFFLLLALFAFAAQCFSQNIVVSPMPDVNNFYKHSLVRLPKDSIDIRMSFLNNILKADSSIIDDDSNILYFKYYFLKSTPSSIDNCTDLKSGNPYDAISFTVPLNVRLHKSYDGVEVFLDAPSITVSHLTGGCLGDFKNDSTFSIKDLTALKNYLSISEHDVTTLSNSVLETSRQLFSSISNILLGKKDDLHQIPNLYAHIPKFIVSTFQE